MCEREEGALGDLWTLLGPWGFVLYQWFRSTHFQPHPGTLGQGASRSDRWHLQSPASSEQHCHFVWTYLVMSLFGQKLLFLLHYVVWSPGRDIAFSMKHSLGPSALQLGSSTDPCSWEEDRAPAQCPPLALLAPLPACCGVRTPGLLVVCNNLLSSFLLSQC